MIDGNVVEVKKIKVFQFDILDMNTAFGEATRKFHLWKTSEAGSWIMDRAVGPPEWIRIIEPQNFAVRYAVTAKIIDRDYTYWVLKWGGEGLVHCYTSV